MNPSNGKTVWEHEEKKWRPRTYQAAKMLFPAHDIHRPPEEEKKPVFALTQSEIFEIESMHRKERIKHLVKQADEKAAKKRARKKAIADAKAEHIAKTGKKVGFERRIARYKNKQMKKLRDVAKNIQKLTGS